MFGLRGVLGVLVGPRVNRRKEFEELVTRGLQEAARGGDASAIAARCKMIMIAYDADVVEASNGSRMALAMLVAPALDQSLRDKIRSDKRYYDARTSPLGRRAFLAAAERGDFPAYRMGHVVVALRDDVHAWIESMPVKELG